MTTTAREALTQMMNESNSDQLWQALEALLETDETVAMAAVTAELVRRGELVLS